VDRRVDGHADDHAEQGRAVSACAVSEPLPGRNWRRDERPMPSCLRPKFAAVEEVLSRELGGKGLARWTRPKGGYFISFDTEKPVASTVVKLAKEAGVALTPAGATYPFGKDPNDRNIRIRPPAHRAIRCARQWKWSRSAYACVGIAASHSQPDLGSQGRWIFGRDQGEALVVADLGQAARR